MEQRTSQTRLFLKQARENFMHTGAIVPSSRFLARAVTAAIGPKGPPLTVLEAGAGTGALTGEILHRLPRGSRLDVYEVNPIFAGYLERSFTNGGPHTSHLARRPERDVEVSIRNARVQEVPPLAQYDAIISGLPLNNFEPRLVREILETLFGALRPGGVLSYFEYLLIRELKSLATGRHERRRLRRVGRVTGGFLQKYEFHREAVFLNIPPATVHHLRKPA
ncbi:MAG TPA: hypothetical protein VFG76_11415 [Candidatus Polarisedimenticolia bacterium]|nr:hypothetical protein [Candidatus Polarisedimenticolia bacterium]